jgi:hypothetical protein
MFRIVEKTSIASPFSKGEKEEFLNEGIQKSSSPLEKGRTGGISEPLSRHFKKLK